jgi:hypothetical protein
MDVIRMNRQLFSAPSRFGWRVGITAVIVVSMSGMVWAQKMEPPATDGIEATANVELTNDQLAARFLDQATAGATPEDVASLSAALAARPNTAFAEWLNDQYAKPVQDSDLSLPIFRAMFDNQTPATSYHRHAGEAAEVRASLMISDHTNELRRAIAYALSQIFVVSDQDNPLEDKGDVRLVRPALQGCLHRFSHHPDRRDLSPGHERFSQRCGERQGRVFQQEFAAGRKLCA